MTISIVDAYVCRLQRAPRPITQPVLKFGGQPVFYSNSDWPTCNRCACEMDFLAQIPLQRPIAFSPRLAMAYVFMCPGKFTGDGMLVCETWDANSGCNTVILQAESDRVCLGANSAYPDYEVTLTQKKEPDIDTSSFDEDESVIELVSESSKLGGVAAWLQTNETPTCPACNGQMRFCSQLNAELDGPLPADPKQWNDDDFKFLHFGGDGLGYLFLCHDACSASGAAFLWQCT